MHGRLGSSPALAPVRCLACNKPVDAHHRWDAADIAGSAGASYGSPVVLASGWKVLAPLSPSIIGRFAGHDPMLPRGAA